MIEAELSYRDPHTIYTKSHLIPSNSLVWVPPGTLGFPVGTEDFTDDGCIEIVPGRYTKFGPSFHSRGKVYDLYVGVKRCERCPEGSGFELTYYLIDQTTVVRLIANPNADRYTGVY